ncbi:MAG: protein-disulfide reductase DsbD [Pseudomonadota bacterium]
MRTTLAKLTTLILALLAMLPAALAVEEPLKPEDAFRYEVTDEGSALRIDWTLAPGYYLYQHKLGFTATGDITLGAPELPEGLAHSDEFFGERTIYRDAFTVRIPYSGGGTATLEIKSQGCADLGICYPPLTWTRDIAAGTGGAGTAAADRAAIDVFGQQAAPLNTGVPVTSSSGDFLPPDEAFRPLVDVLDAQTVEIGWQIAPGYYLYRDSFDVASLAEPVNVEKPIAFPPAKSKYDEYFGDTAVYYNDALYPITLSFADDTTASFSLKLNYQGCAEDGICYPPSSRYVDIDLRRLAASVLPAGAEPTMDGGSPGLAASGIAAATSGITANAATAAVTGESAQDRFARIIREGSLWVVLATFFGAGLLLSLTPCVLPMIPILTGIIAGDKATLTPVRGFSLALTYVLGMALTYTIAGALFAAAGQQAQAVFQQPWILVLFAGLFVVLAISMFGAFELQMPSSIQSRLAAISGRQESGTFVGAFVMGVLSSLIVTACVAPPLVAALAVIGQSGDVVRGASALFVMSIGMGAPLLVVGASAGKFMPKTGSWMVAVKVGFGFVMLALAVYILDRLLPGPLTLALYGTIAVFASIYFGGLDTLTAESTAGRRAAKAFGILGLVYGASLLLGALSGNDDPLQPISFAATGGGDAAETQQLDFVTVRSVAELDAQLAAARDRGQPVMLDFYADWCVECKVMEKYTFSDTAVRQVLSPALLLKADVTANNADDRALLGRFDFFGPPGIVFYNGRGEEHARFRVVGEMGPSEFSAHVAAAFGSS